MIILAFIFLALALGVVGWNFWADKKQSERLRVARITAVYPDACIRDMILQNKLWQGMTEVELVASWGLSRGVTQQMLGSGVRRVFRYGANRYASGVYLQNGRVTGWR